MMKAHKSAARTRTSTRNTDVDTEASKQQFARIRKIKPMATCTLPEYYYCNFFLAVARRPGSAECEAGGGGWWACNVKINDIFKAFYCHDQTWQQL